MASTAQQLQQTVTEHKEQLKMVTTLLQQDPGNAELIALQNDILQVIALTTDLLQKAIVNPAAEAALRATMTDVARPTAASAASSSTGPPPVPRALLPPPVPAGVQSFRKFKVGDRCLAQWEEDLVYYHARVLDARPNAKYIVQYLEFGNQQEVAEQLMNPFVPADPKLLKVGVPVKAIWPEDQVMYCAVIEAKGSSPQSWIVKFDKNAGAANKKKLEVPQYELIINEKHKAWVEDPSSLPDKVEVPEWLQIKPTDSDKQKLSKQKQVKKLKSEHRQKLFELEGLKKKNNWQNFQAGKIGKKKLNKVSIFASPDTLEGRVGVVGSGKGLTQFEQHHKHEFKEVGVVDTDDSD